MKIDDCDVASIDFGVGVLKGYLQQACCEMTPFQRQQVEKSMINISGAARIVERLQAEHFRNRSRANRKRGRRVHR